MTRVPMPSSSASPSRSAPSSSRGCGCEFECTSRREARSGWRSSTISAAAARAGIPLSDAGRLNRRDERRAGDGVGAWTGAGTWGAALCECSAEGWRVEGGAGTMGTARGVTDPDASDASGMPFCTSRPSR
jgi:hypothetical protein